jgi:hypothetical protein
VFDASSLWVGSTGCVFFFRPKPGITANVLDLTLLRKEGSSASPID